MIQSNKKKKNEIKNESNDMTARKVGLYGSWLYAKKLKGHAQYNKLTFQEVKVKVKLHIISKKSWETCCRACSYII